MQGQADLCELKASMVYTEKPCHPVLKKLNHHQQQQKTPANIFPY